MGTHFSEIWIEIQQFSFEKRRWKCRQKNGGHFVSASRRLLHHLQGDHYNNVIMSAMASQNTSVSIVYSIVCSGADQRKHQNSASLAFVGLIHRWPVNSPHKWPVKRKTFPFDDVINFQHCPSVQISRRSFSLHIYSINNVKLCWLDECCEAKTNNKNNHCIMTHGIMTNKTSLLCAD